ncbi:Non-structural maintenance of chromosomes element 1 [Hibiscus syriacus]|uniref:Non-structural maintenance of chromosomes element 1 homolog n=1 Tax=Hibiscus syriacus TaxID=106335 RepID=A0A6A2WU61_HIBSY|nr:non-structural maintenance of chromosomes element 1 homolog isoform X1 [Hibiscus syriacus]KAE8664963.1 Non-structural maintenance of chromosomes element 1 [Hibiscus syriacus]
MAVLSWKHHTLIQLLLERGPLTEKEFHSIFTAITGENPGTHPRKFNDYLLKINRELSYVQLDLRACRDTYDGRVYYGVVNNVSDNQSKLGTKYSVPQIAFFKAIVEAIAQDVTAEGCICNMDVLNIKLENQDGSLGIPAAFRNFTMSQKEKTLDQLVKDKWLCYTEDDNIGVGVRSVLDLRSWFNNAGVPSCEVCNEAGLKAKLCPNEGCTVRIHEHCLKKIFSQKGVVVCPSCDTRWQYQPPKTEPIELKEEETDPMPSQPSSRPAQSQSSLRSKRKRQRLSQNDDANTVGCSSQAEMKRVTRSSAHPR